MTAVSNSTQRRRAGTLAASAALVLFALAALGYGAWSGFPEQDDNYMIRLLRLGGPERIAADHPDRPVYGLLLAALTRWGGESRAFYVSIGLLGWLLLAAEAIGLWVSLFPEWRAAWPVVGLAIVSPVVVSVQFSTLTTLLPCVLPVMLVAGGLLLVLRARDARPGRGILIAAFLATLAAAVLSEYALATAAAAIGLLVVLGRWRDGIPFVAGAPLGYLAFRALGTLSVRKETDPHLQLVGALSRPWTRPFRVASAGWDSVVGAWGGAASSLQVDWSSGTTVLAAALGFAVGLAAATVWRARGPAPEPSPAGRRILALGAAVFAGLYPPITIMGWPLRLVFETRYLLPGLLFAICMTVAAVLALCRPARAAVPIFLLSFVAANALALRALEERRAQRTFENVARRLQPYVGDRSGLVVLVLPDRLRQSKEEVMAKITYGWKFPQAARLVLLRPLDALYRFGPRSGCGGPDARRFWPQTIRWPRAEEPVRLVLWDSGDLEAFDPEPYYRGCAAP